MNRNKSPQKRLIGKLAITGALTSALVLGQAGVAAACGCFTPPDPSVPIVQAGERIVFATDGENIVSHIQIQFSGSAEEFGWILPLPTIPTLELGTDELFNALIAQTQPKYRLRRVFPDNCGAAFGFGGAPQAAGRSNDATEGGAGESSPVVIQDSIGPFDYAVLKADDKKEMLDWLATNRYFVPVGTDDVVAPYINPGAYFLALKLRSGKSTGDLQPVIVRYKSDLAMIPIELTSVTAVPNMGIQVWMLGGGRAIPRNYFHTVINDAAIDWLNAGANYNDIIIRAVNETPGHHTFVTEFAGKSSRMDNVLIPQGRFGSAAQLRTLLDPVQYVQYLRNNGYGVVTSSGGGGPIGPIQQFSFPSTLVEVLKAHIPFPAELEAQGVTAEEYYLQLSYYLGDYRKRNPTIFAGLDFNYDPVKLTAEITERVVQPVRDADKLFKDFPYMTRLYTTLSPEDMNRDPVFSYNPELPDYDNTHEATLTYECNFRGEIEDAWLKTETGFNMRYPGGNAPEGLPNLPATRRTEILREAGAPEVVLDNGSIIEGSLGSKGCSVGSGASDPGGSASLAFLVGLALLAARRRRGAIG